MYLPQEDVHPGLSSCDRSNARKHRRGMPAGHRDTVLISNGRKGYDAMFGAGGLIVNVPSTARVLPDPHDHPFGAFQKACKSVFWRQHRESHAEVSVMWYPTHPCHSMLSTTLGCPVRHGYVTFIDGTDSPDLR
jgi:hypothetical protein